MYTTILSTDELAAHLSDPAWVIVDCRFDLQNPEWGQKNYQLAHIPGAMYAHLDHDLAGPITPTSGRHPLPDLEEFSRKLGQWGISNGSQVVVYDTSGGAFAARLWWMLGTVGLPSVAILDGGFQKWQREGRSTTSGEETRPPTRFIPHLHLERMVDADQVERIRLDPNYLLIDARTPERFRGEREPIDPVAGHIPGAVNRFHGDNLAPDGTFLPSEILHAQFEALIGERPANRVTVYCGSGVTSCHHLVAMELAGLSGARLFPGSWSEWIRDEKRPKRKI